MDPQLQQISKRIRELREILELTPESIAAELKLPPEKYLAYENGEDDIPIGILYGIAAELCVDPTILISGDEPRMNTYTVVRGGEGMKMERYAGYAMYSLAFNFKNREMEPMIVRLSPNKADEEPELVTHSGQEFNIVLKGTVKVVLGTKEIILNEGDSVYYDPSIPHGQRAVGGDAVFLTVINDFRL